MGRSNKVEQIEAAWRTSTGCDSPDRAREKIERLSTQLQGQAELVLIAIQASTRAASQVSEIAAALGCQPHLDSILEAAKARKHR